MTDVKGQRILFERIVEKDYISKLKRFRTQPSHKGTFDGAAHLFSVNSVHIQLVSPQAKPPLGKSKVLDLLEGFV